tara:strand:+ start:704 stop:865 length:162 start_codon:yes stop_codon:yes gene_type:complete
MPLIPKKWREEFNDLRPPVNNALQGDSSWINLLNGKDQQTPVGWDPGEKRHEH